MGAPALGEHADAALSEASRSSEESTGRRAAKITR
jgi:hypothetical protein